MPRLDFLVYLAIIFYGLVWAHSARELLVINCGYDNECQRAVPWADVHLVEFQQCFAVHWEQVLPAQGENTESTKDHSDNNLICFKHLKRSTLQLEDAVRVLRLLHVGCSASSFTPTNHGGKFTEQCVGDHTLIYLWTIAILFLCLKSPCVVSQSPATAVLVTFPGLVFLAGSTSAPGLFSLLHLEFILVEKKICL